jgi:hypothetical protein
MSDVINNIIVFPKIDFFSCKMVDKIPAEAYHRYFLD